MHHNAQPRITESRKTPASLRGFPFNQPNSLTKHVSEYGSARPVRSKVVDAEGRQLLAMNSVNSGSDQLKSLRYMEFSVEISVNRPLIHNLKAKMDDLTE